MNVAVRVACLIIVKPVKIFAVAPDQTVSARPTAVGNLNRYWRGRARKDNTVVYHADTPGPGEEDSERIAAGQPYARHREPAAFCCRHTDRSSHGLSGIDTEFVCVAVLFQPQSQSGNSVRAGNDDREAGVLTRKNGFGADG